MAAHFSNARQDRPGRGYLATAALGGAVFGGLAVGVLTGAFGSFGTAGLSGPALAGLGALLLIVVGLNLWARWDARRQALEVQRMLVKGIDQYEHARDPSTMPRDTLLPRRNAAPAAGHRRTE